LDFHAYRSDPVVTQYQGFDVMNLSQAHDFIISQKDKAFGQSEEWAQYGIVHRQLDKLIGDCAIRLDASGSQSAEIGITLSRLYQKQGFAQEALKGILNWLFNHTEVVRVVMVTDAENTPSVNLLEQTGFISKAFHTIWFKGRWSMEITHLLP
jgi:RimJ/RimL family protein N-acetyltransferase